MTLAPSLHSQTIGSRRFISQSARQGLAHRLARTGGLCAERKAFDHEVSRIAAPATVACSDQARGFATSTSEGKQPSTTPPSEADVVIIGGGSIGVSTLYHLAKMGIRSAVLLEKDELTAGTTWHSAGLVWALRPSDVDTELIGYTRRLAKSIEEETGISPGWTENGGLFTAGTEERLRELRRFATLGKAYGIEAHTLSPAEIKDLYPLANVDDVIGGVYSPTDGTVDPSGIVMALAKGARNRGGTIIEHCGVKSISTDEVNSIIRGPAGTQRTARRVTGVTTTSGHHIKTGIVVNCAGAWAPTVGRMVGTDVPLCVMRHAYIQTERIEGIMGMPNMRDHDASIYLKVQGDALQIGGYEPDPIFWPDLAQEFAFSLVDLDWDVFTPHIVGAVHRVPIVEQTGVKSTVCGPESFTPDHKALMGEVPDVKGFFLGCGFNSAGMMLGGGCGKELATWIVKGRPDIDMYSYDIHRFHPSLLGDQKWVDDRSHEAYAKNYAIVFPHDQPMAGRNKRCDPLYKTLQAKGCVFQERHGFERPGFFIGEQNKYGWNRRSESSTADHALTTEIRDYDFYGSYDHSKHENYGYYEIIDGENTFGWSAAHRIIGEEVDACRNAVAIFNMSYFGKFFLSGPDAQAAMDWICTADVNKPIGRTTYTHMLNENGGIECDLTVSKIEPKDDQDHFYIAAGGGSATHDLEWIKSVIENKGFDCTIEDKSDHMSLLSVQGPQSRALLSRVAPATDFSNEAFPFSSTKEISVAGHTVRAIRLTFVGELGWELHIPNESVLDVYRALMECGESLGARDGGYRAIDCLSSEKGYRHWHEDVRSDDTPLEASMAFVCKLKTDVPFLGRKALEQQKKEGLKRKLACFTIEDDVPLHGGEAIWRNGECVGYLRRGDYGHSIKAGIGYGYVRGPQGGAIKKGYLAEGTYELEVVGERKVPAKIHLKAVFDPKNDRIKGIYEAETSTDEGLSAASV